MRFFLSVLLVSLTSLLAGCFSDTPSEDQVKNALVTHVNEKKSSDSKGIPDIVFFQKVDGKVNEGKKTYLYFFEADAIFNKDTAFDCFFGMCKVRVKKNQKVHLSGAVLFEKRESGWVSVDNNIKLKALAP